MRGRTGGFGNRASAGSMAAALVAAGVCTGAGALTELEDTVLSGVSARGLAFNLQDMSLTGGVALDYRGAAGQRLTLDDLEVSRSDDPDATFSDPYRLQLISRGEGHADAVELSTPLNRDGQIGWRMVADWRSFDGPAEFNGGALIVDNLQSRGNSLSLSAPDSGDPEAILFGARLNYDIDAVTFRPRGRDNATRQLSIRGIHLGTRNGGSWQVASLDNQPGTFRATSSGSLQLQLDWPRNKVAPIGSIAIDNVDIYQLLDAGLLPLVPVGARIGIGVDRVQLQHLDVRLHP